MTDLNELFKIVSEGKKQYEETDPTGQKIKRVKEHVKEDLSSLFSQLVSLKEDLEKELVVEEAKLEPPMITEEIPAQPVIHTPEVREKQVDADVDKYLTDKSFQQPNPDLVTKNIDDIRNKIKFLEQAIGRVAAAGPGGGEVNLRYLDDVDRSTITDGWYLRYNATKKKFEFAEVISSGGNGATGPAGATGPGGGDTGATGITGSSGAQGASGLNGSTGPTGASGVSGASGTNGASGIQGASGTQGSTGVQGASGVSGIDGATGITGASGASGATGIAGSNGATGIDGASGIQGASGSTGISGASGVGVQGASGSTGLTGATGIPGASGIGGATGALPDLPTGEPMGHTDRTQSIISFDDASRTFSISPVAASFEIWTKGVKRTITDTRQVTIPDTTGLYYIYFDPDGILQYRTEFFDWPNDCVTAYVYWNDVTNDAPFVADERHGIVLDWQTHEYLHRTRGAAIANGFGATNYIVNGDGSLDSHMQIDIASGTFFDEDLQVDIVNTNTPVANTWDQDLAGPARIPMFYINSAGGWVIDTPTNFPVKMGTLPKYNLYSGGVWTTPDIDNNKFGITFIIATNNINYPVIGIIGQNSHANQGAAEAVDFSELNLAGFPVVEMRPLYKLVYECKASYTNSVNARLKSIWDQRSFESTVSAIATYTDHGALGGLSDDDHPQYLLRTDAVSFVGATGATGIQGASGSTGLTGATGISGASGISGSASTLTGTSLATGIVSSSLTSVGTLTGLTSTGSVTANNTTAFIAGDNAISGVALQVPSEGAIRNLTNGLTNMYFDVSIGGSTHGQFQFRSSSSFTNVLTMSPTAFNINPNAVVTARTPSFGRLPWNSAIDTELTIDDYRFRVSNSGGIYPQIISNVSGQTKNSAWTAVAAISGQAVGQAGSTGNLVPNNAWVSLYSFAAMNAAGDTVTVTLQDKNLGRIYRVTFMRSDDGSTTGYNIIAERLL